jgi:hypothetical protein
MNPAHVDVKNGAPSGRLRHKLVIATSPNPIHVKGWWKGDGFRFLGTYIMPSWSLDDLHLVCPFFEGLDRNDMIRLYYRYGGVLRPIVGSEQTRVHYEHILQAGLHQLPADTMQTMLMKPDNIAIGAVGANVHVASGLYSLEPSDDNMTETDVASAPSLAP